jgi:hypothetical protein
MVDDEAPPQRTLIATRQEYIDAAGRLFGLARRELRIFDPDLSELDFNAQERIAVLRRLLAAGRMHRVYIALHDVEHASTRCPRLLDLVSTFPAGLLIFRTEGEATRAQDRFVLADDNHLVRCPVATQARGAMFLSDPREAQAMRLRFDQIWESSVPAVSTTKIGL